MFNVFNNWSYLSVVQTMATIVIEYNLAATKLIYRVKHIKHQSAFYTMRNVIICEVSSIFPKIAALIRPALNFENGFWTSKYQKIATAKRRRRRRRLSGCGLLHWAPRSAALLARTVSTQRVCASSRWRHGTHTKSRYSFVFFFLRLWSFWFIGHVTSFFNHCSVTDTIYSNKFSNSIINSVIHLTAMF